MNTNEDNMNKFDTTCEHAKIRMIAATLGFQQCTKTAASVTPIPGGDLVIAIGTPAQVRGLLATPSGSDGTAADNTGGLQFRTVEEFYEWSAQGNTFAPPFSDLHPPAKAEWDRQFSERAAATSGSELAPDERARQIMFAAYSRCIDDDRLSPNQIADVLLSARAALAQQAVAPSNPTEEMLNMLGRIHPFAMEKDDCAKAYERLERAFVIQQPWPVPDQACIVWRADLMDMRYDLIHKQACFDSKRATPFPSAKEAQDAKDASLLNVGHGHVYPRADGIKARCGGPGLCVMCNRDRAAMSQAKGAGMEGGAK